MRTLYCVREGNLIKWFLLLLLPLFLFAALGTFNEDVRKITPTFGCYNLGAENPNSERDI